MNKHLLDRMLLNHVSDNSKLESLKLCNYHIQCEENKWGTNTSAMWIKKSRILGKAVLRI